MLCYLNETLRVNEDVTGFQISMNYVTRVDVLHNTKHLGHYVLDMNVLEYLSLDNCM